MSQKRKRAATSNWLGDGLTVLKLVVYYGLFKHEDVFPTMTRVCKQLRDYVYRECWILSRLSYVIRFDGNNNYGYYNQVMPIPNVARFKTVYVPMFDDQILKIGTITFNPTLEFDEVSSMNCRIDDGRHVGQLYFTADIRDKTLYHMSTQTSPYSFYMQLRFKADVFGPNFVGFNMFAITRGDYKDAKNDPWETFKSAERIT